MCALPDQPLSNEPVDVTGLPRLLDESFVAVDPRHAIGMIAALVAGAAVVIGGGAVATSLADEAILLLIAIVFGVLLLAAATVSWLAARRVSYQVREHDLSMRRGLIMRSEATVPFRRVQHVHMSRGLLERSFGLASLSINSAGPDIAVPGLPVDVATTLRAWIVERADLDAEARPDLDAPGATTVPWDPPEP